jgi:hypothetical protein
MAPAELRQSQQLEQARPPERCTGGSLSIRAQGPTAPRSQLALDASALRLALELMLALVVLLLVPVLVLVLPGVRCCYRSAPRVASSEQRPQRPRPVSQLRIRPPLPAHQHASVEPPNRFCSAPQTSQPITTQRCPRASPVAGPPGLRVCPSVCLSVRASLSPSRRRRRGRCEPAVLLLVRCWCAAAPTPDGPPCPISDSLLSFAAAIPQRTKNEPLIRPPCSAQRTGVAKAREAIDSCALIGPPGPRLPF